MSAVAIGMWSVAAALGLAVGRRRGGAGVVGAGRFAWKQATALAIRLPLALLAASFLSQIVPTESIGHLLGGESGARGVVLAAVLGGILPGGPMASFPIALFVWQAGAGPAQMVAMLAGWSVFAMHRVLAFEAPLMGWRFSALRLSASFLLPFAAGLLAAGLVDGLGLSAALAP